VIVVRALRWVLAALPFVLGSAGAAAQTFPSKPITFVVPYAAGGNVDVSARTLQAGIGLSLGQPILVEDRPGAGGTIAGEYVARSAPDGHTLFVGSNGPIMLGPMTMAKPPYQWDQVFAPVSTLAFATNMLLVRPTLPVNSVAELVDYAKKNPGKLTLATSGITSINHFMGELLKLKAGITWAEVHYRGNAPAITDLIAGHVDLGLQQLVDSLAYIKAGKLKALAVLGPKRVAALPDVPTIGEAGYPDVQGVTFNGLFAPKATPPAVVAQLSVAIRDVLLKPAVVERLAALGSDARGSTPEEFAKFLNDETRKWTAVMKQANIKGTP
jgi:tripartite-type tricarboxylate transporter receptor subunit TctC